MTSTIDPFDELAAMFLTAAPGTAAAGRGAATATLDAPAPRAAPPASAFNAGATLELLIVGHLPVRANLWLMPYADAVARLAGATALLRMDGEHPSIDVLRSEEASLLPASRTLREEIQLLAPAIERWIVLAGRSATREELANGPGGRMVLLTSADEAAIVAAYQSIKELAGAAGEGRHPEVALAVVGADESAARGVVERLNRTTASFLGVEIGLALALPRMDAGSRCMRSATFSAEPMPGFAEVCAWLREASRQPRAPRHAPPGVPSQARPRDARAPEPVLLDAQRVLRPAGVGGAGNGSLPFAAGPAPPPLSSFAPSIAPAPPAPLPPQPFAFPRPGLSATARAQVSANPGAGDPPRPSAPATPRAMPATMKLAPKPSMQVEPKLSLQPREPDEDGQPIPLARHVEGLIALPVRSPGHEHVELAVDRAGRLHLLARESSLRDLHIVEHWAKAHRELLALACPQHAINQALPPRGHLFTDKPATLADLHNANLNLHVLAPVQVEGKTAWYSAPLNVLR